jgi:TonB-linked SusC/RagA family outer membrane protein
MYKNYTGKFIDPPGRFYKILLMFKLTVFLIVVSLMQVSASVSAQRLSMVAKKASLKQVFAEISRQTGYDVVWAADKIKDSKSIDLNFKDAPLNEVLDYCLEKQQLSYRIEDKTILIERKQRSVLERIADYFAAIDVKGKVVDEQGASLPGASVMIKATNRIVITDSRGEFSFGNVPQNAILVVSFIGYQTRETPAASDMVVRMSLQNTDLNEVSISTGYQKIEKYQLTGAATAISQKTYDQRVAVTGNFLESLEGKIPGLIYNSQSGELSIRGVSTFNAVKKPLIVVDGFPSEIDINTINPNDIVSVNVLRDAVAASVYGVRASNGVIVIETKRGQLGKPVFSFRSTYAVQQKPDFDYLKIADAATYARVQYAFLQEQALPEFLFDLIGWPVNPVQRVAFDRESGKITDEQADTRLGEIGSYNNLNEYNNLFYQSRQARQIDFDVSGGGDRSTYLLGFNYLSESPLEQNSSNKRLILNVANTYNFSKRFKLDYRGTYTHTNSERGTIPTYNDALPYERLADDNGNALPVINSPGGQFYGAINKTRNDALLGYGLYDQRYFPYRELTANTFTGSRNAMRFQGRLNARITDWLNLDLGGVYENELSREKQLQTDESYHVRYLLNSKASKDPATGQPVFINMPQGDILSRINTQNWGYTARGQFNFNYRSKDNTHDLSGIAGVEQRRQALSGDKNTAFGYDGQSLVIKPINMQVLSSDNSPAYTEVGNAGATFNPTDYFAESADDRRFMSYYSEATYLFRQKYIATGSIRFDRSNLFGTAPEYRNKPFWSAGLGWRINKESFLNQAAWLTDLKLRASYGFNGNIPTSNNGPFLILQSGLNSRLNTAEIYNDVQSPENQSIRWESTTNYNLGLDFGLFNNRLSGSADLYYKDANDVFGRYSSDPTTGFNEYTANTASILNKGLEIGLYSQNLQSERFAWRSTLTATFNKNEVTEVKPSDNFSSYDIVNGVTVQKGYPIDVLLSYRYKGLNALGQPVVFTKDGKEVVMDGANGRDVALEDLVYNGTTTPKYVLGFNNQFSVRNFDLSFLFMYYGGHVMRIEQPNPDDINFKRILTGSDAYWKKPGDELNTIIPGIPEYESEGDYDYTARAGYINADRFVRKADNIRLRDVILTYNFKSPFFKKIGLSNTQFRVQGQNLWNYTFSGNDIDPDAIDKRYGIRTLKQEPFYSFSLYANF